MNAEFELFSLEKNHFYFHNHCLLTPFYSDVKHTLITNVTLEKGTRVKKNSLAYIRKLTYILQNN